jgi:hypothetical protein
MTGATLETGLLFTLPVSDLTNVFNITRTL